MYVCIWASQVIQWWRIHCQWGRCKRLGLHSCVGKIPWRRKWKPTPVFLPGKFHGERSLAGYSPCGHKVLDTDAGKDWGQEEKGATEDEMIVWHHWLNGHEFEQSQGDSEGQGSLVCCSPWGHKESDATELLKNHNKVLLSRWESFAFQVPIAQLRKIKLHTLKWQGRQLKWTNYTELMVSTWKQSSNTQL